MTRYFRNSNRLLIGASVALCIAAFLGLQAIAQKDSEPKLVHKHTEHFCESGRSVVDLLLLDLLKEPKLKGVIVLHPSPHDPLWPYKEKVAIINLLKFRSFDLDRIVFSLGEPEFRTSTELWKTPEDKVDGFKGRDWDLSLSQLKAPLMVHSKSWIDGVGCGLFEFSHKFFADVLRRNQDVVGRVVVREASTAKFEAARRKISAELSNTHKVQKTQLEFAFLKDKNVDIEYWLFPPGFIDSFPQN